MADTNKNPFKDLLPSICQVLCLELFMSSILCTTTILWHKYLNELEYTGYIQCRVHSKYQISGSFFFLRQGLTV
jgi:hypothetical protein